jgi:anti-anti-sigma regulatory factor
MPIAVQTEDQTQTISLDGCVHIDFAAELKNTLLNALQNSQELRIDVGKLESLDLTAYQLLWAAKLEALRTGRRFHVEGSWNAEIEAGLQLAGLSPFQLFTSTEGTDESKS